MLAEFAAHDSRLRFRSSLTSRERHQSAPASSEAGGIISGMEGDDDPLKTGHVVCGNEYVHGELVKILGSLDK